jgi:hypothetical protein
MKFEDLWRPVDTGDADKIEFCRGDANPQFWLGCMHLAVSVFLFGSLLWVSFSQWNTFLDGLRRKEYNIVVLLYCLGAASFTFALGSFLFGIWTLFGRTRVVLDRVYLSIIKEYRVRSFCLLSRSYLVGNSASFFLRRKPRSFALHFVCLTDEKGKRRRLLIIPRKFAQDGWAMAEQMAGVLGISLLTGDAA